MSFSDQTQVSSERSTSSVAGRFGETVGFGMDRILRIYTVAMGLAFGAAGSAGTVLVWVAIIWSIIRTIQLNTPILWPRPIVFLTLAAVLYWLSGAFMVIANPDDAANRWMLLERAFAPGLLLFHARLALSPPRAILLALAIAAALGAIASAGWAFHETVWLGLQRARGAAGNAGPYATVGAVLFSLSLAGVSYGQLKKHPLTVVLLIAGCACGAFSVIASGMRTLLPILVIVPTVIVAFHTNRRQILTLRTAFFVLVGIVAIGFVTADNIGPRLAKLADEISTDGFAPNPSTSLGQRMAVWQCAAEELPNLWVTGEGRADAQTLMGDCTLANTQTRIQFSHFHNAVLNALMYGGLLELVAVLGMLLSPLLVLANRGVPPSLTRRAGMAMTCCIVIIYALNGATNLMFGHDLLDALYVYFIAATLAVARKDETEKQSS